MLTVKTQNARSHGRGDTFPPCTPFAKRYIVMSKSKRKTTNKRNLSTTLFYPKNCPNHGVHFILVS
jgi:hypothetical protein